MIYALAEQVRRYLVAYPDVPHWNATGGQPVPEVGGVRLFGAERPDGRREVAFLCPGTKDAWARYSYVVDAKGRPGDVQVIGGVNLTPGALNDLNAILSIVSTKA